MKEYSYFKKVSAIKESKESDKLADGINKLMDDIDENMSTEDFALAVGKVLKEEYGTLQYMPFMKILHKDLGIK